MLRLRTFCMEASPMNTEDFIIALFCRIDDAMAGVRKHSQARLSPGEVVTLAVLFAIKGVTERAFYRWLKRDWSHLFPRLPDRTRFFRLLQVHRGWTDRFLADPTLFGVADTYGIELIHPVREGRSRRQIGKKGLSNKRWIVGGKLGFVLNRFGRVCSWDCSTANTHDKHFRHLVGRFEGEMIVLTDGGFHGEEGDPSNMKICAPRTWNERMVVETVLSMLTTVCHLKKLTHRVWAYFVARMAFTMAAFNLLADWSGIRLDKDGSTHLSIAEFGL